MTSVQIAQLLQERFPGKILHALPDDKHPRIELNAADWPPIAELMRNEPSLQFDWLACLSAIDYIAENQFALVYDLMSFDLKHTFAVKVFIPRDNPKIASCAHLWRAADWHEREAYDMMGIVFDNHPDFRRILLPDDWVGFPLRKDYVFPKEYDGIPGSVEMDWKQKPDYPA